ncbi:MAG: HIT domain-containing protein [Propionibacteriaceae bacterium]|nr:HIT domain-containing protein [Propionibacteriaceae bacterium]
MMSLESSGEFAGVEDGFERLWTPHRMVYIDSQKKPLECPFCVAPTKSDEEALIIHRGETCFVVMNLFPYNPGHLLICPYRHVADLTDLTSAELLEVGELTAHAMRTIRATTPPAGFNIGVNQGVLAGTGIAEHFHQHLVPRWTGDANFFPIIARTKALPRLLGETREELSQAWGAS